MSGCARCAGPLPRFPEWVNRDGERVTLCGWKCGVLVRAEQGDAEAIAFATYYGWQTTKTAGAAVTDAGPLHREPVEEIRQ